MISASTDVSVHGYPYPGHLHCRYLCMLAKIKSLHIFMGIGPFAPHIETLILHYKVSLNTMFDRQSMSQLQDRKMRQKCSVYFTYI